MSEPSEITGFPEPQRATNAVGIPAALVDEVANGGEEQERLEAWILGRVEAGEALPGLYPPNAENKARYEAEKKR